MIDRRMLLCSGGLAVVGAALAACSTGNGKWPTFKSATDDEDPCAGVKANKPETWKYHVSVPTASGKWKALKNIVGQDYAKSYGKKHPAHKVIRYC